LRTLVQLVAIGLSRGAVYALVALGITLIYRTTNILNFAQGQVLMVAVFTSLTFNQNPLRPIPLPIAWLAGIVVAMFLGLLIELGVRPTLKYKGSIGWILATVAMATIIQFAAPYIWPAEDRPYPSPFPNDVGVPGLGSLVSQRQAFTILIAFGLMVLVDLLYNKTKFGRAMKAVAVDRDTASLMGISPKRTVRWAFLLASILAAIAGYLVAPLAFANINMGFDLGVKGFVSSVLGGIDSARGAMAGGILLGLFEASLPQILGLVNANLAKFPDPFVFLLFILVLVFRPQGLFGTSIREAR
jgi:branched-chain amino acid transport system permease protein